MYFCIDMKCFFASVECALRGLNPLTTPLVVADASRGEGTICLAVSPYLKNKGVKNRCRLYQIPKNIAFIQAKPRMKRYMEYAIQIHKIFLRYVEGADIHTYSVDEAFLEITDYLHLYQSPKEMALKIMKDIERELGIIATCGAGENLYLAKLALDIKAKKEKNNYYELTRELFFKEIWENPCLTDIWQIGRGLSKRLNKLGLFCLKDIAYCDKEVLEREFGVVGKDLYEHSWGIDDTKIADIKAYEPLEKSISRNQVFFKDYTKKEAFIPLIEMLYLMCMELYEKKLRVRHIGFYIGYSQREKTSHLHFYLDYFTNEFFVIEKELKKHFQNIEDKPIRRIGIHFSDFIQADRGNNTLFFEPNPKYERLCNAIQEIWQKYGKNKLVLATAPLEESTLYDRNLQIGGHNSDG